MSLQSMGRAVVILALAAVTPQLGVAQESQSAVWAARTAGQYRVYPNLTYLTANNFEAKLDIYKRRDTSGVRPTMISIHGGGWTGGTREGLMMLLMPWFEMGWNVVNVDYRVARVSPAPAAVEDCLCALRWIAAHADAYDIDLTRLVVNGDSAGGHLTLTTGMIPESAGLDRQCPGVPLPRVAAMVNWYGITDVGDLLDGPNRRPYAVTWLGSALNRDEIAKRVSPLTYVRPGLPPILTIHGDADPVVPYAHAVRLQEALSTAGVPNELVTVAGGKHGNFTPDEYVTVFQRVREFLAKHGLTPK